MASKTIRCPSLFLRSGYFVDNLCVITGQGATRLERRIREHQYESKGLKAPSDETVRDYFRLYRAVAFEPHIKEDSFAPWLLAAELEVPGSSFAFFHPLFDLLFGIAESTAFWSARFANIPSSWIAEMENRGDSQIAEEWRAMNAAGSIRRHRKREVHHPDHLTFIHLSMMRLPEIISGRLFERRGLATTWARCHSGLYVEDINFFKQLSSLDGLCALVLLVKEGAEIGDIQRFRCAKEGAMQLIDGLANFPGCRRIHEKLKWVLLNELENNTIPRRYSRTFYYGFGLPTSWRAMASELLLEDQMKRMLKSDNEKIQS